MEYDLYIDPETLDIALDEDGELMTVEGPAVYAQNVRALLQTFTGEWFLDVSQGTKYDEILGEYPDDMLAESIIAEAVYQEEQVAAIDDLQVELIGRDLHIIVEARLKSGDNISVEVTGIG